MANAAIMFMILAIGAWTLITLEHQEAEKALVEQESSVKW